MADHKPAREMFLMENVTDHKPPREMFLMGNEDGSVWIQCRRKGCMVAAEAYGEHMRLVWLQIPLPYDADPRDVERVWMQHRLDHANREK